MFVNESMPKKLLCRAKLSKATSQNEKLRSSF